MGLGMNPWTTASLGTPTAHTRRFLSSSPQTFVSPTLRFANKPFKLWLARIEADDPNLMRALDWIDRVNTAIFRKFDETYDG